MLFGVWQVLLLVSSLQLVSAAPSGIVPRRCGTDTPKAVTEQITKGGSFPLKAPGDDDFQLLTGPIPIYWHVIYSSVSIRNGYIPDGQIEDAITVLNSDYSGTGFSFYLAEIDRTLNPTWFDGVYINLTLHDDMTTTLHQGNESTLNIYSVGFRTDLTDGLLGYATLPEWTAFWPELDGVIIKYSTLPGGSQLYYNQGKTLTHEVGHWLGLLHTFEGESCFGDGDLVDDTPQQSIPTEGCPGRKDTCLGGGLDLINNFMDYSYDACLESFTPGQIRRAQAQARTYRGIVTE